MRDRKPFNLRALAVLHNVFMFSLSLWMVVETLSQVRTAIAEEPYCCASADLVPVRQHSPTYNF